MIPTLLRKRHREPETRRQACRRRRSLHGLDRRTGRRSGGGRVHLRAVVRLLLQGVAQTRERTGFVFLNPPQ